MTTTTVPRALAATKRTASAIVDVAENTARVESVSISPYVSPTILRTAKIWAIDALRDVYIETEGLTKLFTVDADDNRTEVLDITSCGGDIQDFYDDFGAVIKNFCACDNGDWVLGLGRNDTYDGDPQGMLFRLRAGEAEWETVASQVDGSYSPESLGQYDNALYCGDYNTQSPGYHCGYYMYRIDLSGETPLVDKIYTRADPDTDQIHVHHACIDPTNTDRVFVVFGSGTAKGRVVPLTKPDGWEHGDGEWDAGTDPLWGTEGNIFKVLAHGNVIDVLDEQGDVWEFDPATETVRCVYARYLNWYADAATAYVASACGDIMWLGDGVGILACFAYQATNPAATGLFVTADSGKTWSAIWRADNATSRGIRGMYGPWHGKILLMYLSDAGVESTATIDTPDIALTDAIRIGKGYINELADPGISDYFGHNVVGAGNSTITNYINWNDGVNLRYICPGTGPQVLTELGVQIVSGTGNVRLAIYTEAGALLYQGSAEIATSGAGWYSHKSFVDGAGAPVASPSLTGGTGYIIAVTGDGSSLAVGKDTVTTGYCKYKGTDYTGGFPTTLPTPTNSVTQVSVRAGVAGASWAPAVSTATRGDGTTSSIGNVGAAWTALWGNGVISAVTGGEHGLHALQLYHNGPGSLYKSRYYSAPLKELSGNQPANGDKLTFRFRAKAISVPGDYRIQLTVYPNAGTCGVKQCAQVQRVGTEWTDHAVFYQCTAGGTTIGMVHADLTQVDSSTPDAKEATVLIDAVELIIDDERWFDPGDFQPGGTARGDEYALVPFVPGDVATWTAVFDWRPGSRSGNHGADIPIVSILGADGSWVDLSYTVATSKFTLLDDNSDTVTTSGTYTWRQNDVLRFVLTSNGTDTLLYILDPKGGATSLTGTAVNVTSASILRLGISGDNTLFGVGQYFGVKAIEGYKTAEQATDLINVMPTEAVVAPNGIVAISANWTLPAIDVDLGNVALRATTDVTIDGGAALSVISQGADLFSDGGGKQLTVKDLAATGLTLRSWCGGAESGTVSGVQTLPTPPDNQHQES